MGGRWHLLMAALIALTACDGGAEVADAPTPEPSPASIWVAVFEVAPDPGDLEASLEELQDRVGEEAVLSSPAGCLGGVEEEGIPGDNYVLGVYGSEEPEMEGAVERSGREPLFQGEYADLCG